MLLGILLAAVIVVCIALVGVILLQRSEGGVLGMSGGGPGNFMSARGTGDLLTRTTQILAAIFFSLCLLMTLVTGHLRREASLASKLKDLSITPTAPASSQAPATPAPTIAAPPLSAAPAPAPANDGLNLFGADSANPPAAAPHLRETQSATPIAPIPAAPPKRAAKPVKRAAAKPSADATQAAPSSAAPAPAGAAAPPAPPSPPAPSSADSAAPPAGR